MLKRIFTVIKKDMLTSTRDAMLLYIIIAPIMIAVLLNLFIPSADASSLKFAVLKQDVVLSEFLSDYGKIETLNNVDAINVRVLKIDDICGVYQQGDGYKIVLEGNETGEFDQIVRAVLMEYEDMGENLPVTFSVTSLGKNISMVAIIGAISVIMLCMVLGGMITGFNIVEEKQFNTMSAINVSPVKGFEFIIAKALPGLVIPILQSIVALLILKFTNIDWGMAIVLIAISSLISLIIGFLVGVLNDDPITAIASLKLIMLPLSATVIGALLLSEKLQILLYWIPFYWQFKGIYAIVEGSSTWGMIGLYSAIILIETAIVYMLVRKKIRRAL